jgi:hypothetical protein
MKHIVSIWCTNYEPKHKMLIELDLRSNAEDVEVFGSVPKHCPICDQAFSEMDRDGFLMEIGELVDKLVHKEYPNIYVRVFPEDLDDPRTSGVILATSAMASSRTADRARLAHRKVGKRKRHEDEAASTDRKQPE